ncbi:hypothetical protein P7C73_g2814, partial [Tremellales sp. Uapishka_1]
MVAPRSASKTTAKSPEVVEDEPEQEGEEEVGVEAEQKGGEEDDEEEGDEEGGEEYEIEAILDHSLENGKYTYLVAWKNYGPEHNSWEPDEHLHAPEIVNKYMSKIKAAAPPITKKRGRQSASSSAPPPKAKVAKTRMNGRGAGAGKRSAPIDVDEEELEDKGDPTVTYETTHVDSMDKYEDVMDWEEVVTEIDSVERGPGDKLNVYMSMQGGEKLSIPTEIAYARCPQKVLKFYEAHLKWKME